MKILVDIGHPAHVHFFYTPIKKLQDQGHEILVTSRIKDIAIDLLDSLHIKHQVISASSTGGFLSLITELINRDRKLYEVASKFSPDIMAGIGGIFISHIGKIKNIPSLVFYDTENATLQNALTYPFASCVIVPECYTGWVPARRHIRYKGYHELSYLHPAHFQPDRDKAVKNGLSDTGDTFLIRTVSWQASHDIGEQGWSIELLKHITQLLIPHGKVIISCESVLPADLSRYSYQGDVSDIHHVMSFCRGYIGESATMASECAVLGVPAIYAAETGRGYTDEQETKYGLVKNVHKPVRHEIEKAINWLLSLDKQLVSSSHENLLKDTIDVASFIVECITRFPAPLYEYQTTGNA